MNISLTALKRGQKAELFTGRGTLAEEAEFLGVSDGLTQPNDERPVYATMTEALNAWNVRTLPQVEALANKAGKGFGPRLVFRENGNVFSLYLWKGRWCYDGVPNVNGILLH